MKRILMKTACAIAAAIVFATSDARAATERYNVDPDHSIVGFSVFHMVVSKTTGRFKDYAGFIQMDPDAKTVKAIEAVIQTASHDTNHVKRDTHLRSPDFFNVEKYPTMTYKPKDPMGNTRAGFSAHGKINRQDFGMKWSKALDTGGLVVGDDVDINLEIEVIRQK